jgi:DNA-binding NarL/FixJ family response regulator
MPRLADQVERVRSDRLRPRGPSGMLLSAREQEVLRLLAEGCDTTEIATRMAYSERTVKNIIRAILERLGSRNRAHAVAFATREGIV